MKRVESWKQKPEMSENREEGKTASLSKASALCSKDRVGGFHNISVASTKLIAFTRCSSPNCMTLAQFSKS